MSGSILDGDLEVDDFIGVKVGLSPFMRGSSAAPAPAEALQLTVDGREVPTDVVYRATKRGGGFSRAQREILAQVGREGAITATEAGLVMHRERDYPPNRPWVDGKRGTGCRSNGPPLGPTALGCCRFCATDGSLALKRLELRGLLVRTAVGLWEPVVAPAGP